MFPFLVDERGSRILLPLVVGLASRRLDVTKNLACRRTAELLEAVHELVLEPLGRMGIVPDVLTTGIQDSFFPVVVGRIDKVIGCEDTCSMIDGYSAEPH